MKKILSIMFLLMVFVISLFSQQTNNLERQNIDSLVQIIGSEKIPTGTLLIISEKKLNDFDEKLFDKSTWMQLFFELRNATIEREKNVMTINEIARLSSRYLHSDIIPIRVLSKKINTISSDRLQEKLLQGIDVSDIGTSDIFAASASQDYSLNGQEQKFILPSELLFLSEKNATKYFIDFDDGRGFRSIVPDRLITVSYSSIGEKLLKLKILSGKKTMQPEFRFRVKKLKTPNPSATWQITADTPYLNQVAGGQAFVYYGAGHTSLVDPVIIIEGFDIYDEYNWPELYDFINQENLLEDLVSLGFDAIILNFDDPVTYVQRNAFLVMKLIQLINDSVSYSKQALIIGSSMGGL
ncbi:MAG: hypothetical protein U9R19_18210, partial [Bacteroidota bacterium]|nr:hypothetical protein [Bacteroidota bacterium]